MVSEKANRPGPRCAPKDQSIHIFRIPDPHREVQEALTLRRGTRIAGSRLTSTESSVYSAGIGEVPPMGEEPRRVSQRQPPFDW